MSDTLKKFEKFIQSSEGSVLDCTAVISHTGDLEAVSGLEARITRIRNLLTTPVETYPFDPEYGSNLHKQVFELSDSTTTDTIRTEIIGKINKYIEGIIISKVDTRFFADKQGFRVSLLIKSNNEEDRTININFDKRESDFSFNSVSNQ